MRCDRYAECSARTGELMWEVLEDITKVGLNDSRASCVSFVEALGALTSVDMQGQGSSTLQRWKTCICWTHHSTNQVDLLPRWHMTFSIRLIDVLGLVLTKL